MSDSGASTPRAFTAQAVSAEDLLKAQTVGLVKLDDYRKRRRDASKAEDGGIAGGATRRTDEVDTDVALRKKKQKKAGRKLLSFQEDNDEDDTITAESQSRKIAEKRYHSVPEVAQPLLIKHNSKATPSSALPTPKAITKASLAAEAAERERLKAEFVKVQEAVRSSDIAIPFVFYDGSNVPGGRVKVKKGEHIWLFLERCRKLGAELGVSSEGSVEGAGNKRAEGKKSWARIGVDDLMLVRGETIIPHHYDFYYFIGNKVTDPVQPDRLLFDYKNTAKLEETQQEQAGILKRPKDEKIEGQDDDSNVTKVVDRRWYERNKHIYPASLWREYRVDKDEMDTKQGRRDAQGNAFFFS